MNKKKSSSISMSLLFVVWMVRSVLMGIALVALYGRFSVAEFTGWILAGEIEAFFNHAGYFLSLLVAFTTLAFLAGRFIIEVENLLDEAKMRRHCRGPARRYNAQ